MHIMKAENLCRDFRSGGDVLRVLKNLNFNIERGALTILKGRSGSGKTTLLNLMGMLDTPTSGKLFFENREVTSAGEDERDNIRRTKMGFVFQSIALISLMSAYENVEFGLRISSYKPQERKARAEECLNLFGLGSRMRHRPGELSGGEQQRIAIARAIAHKPDIVFADEPTAELDTHTGILVVKLFKSITADKGAAVVMSTHDPGMIDVADKVLTIEDGEIVDER